MSAVFIGCVEFSYTLLEQILVHKAIAISGLITKKASKMNSDFRDLTPLAREHGIPVFYYEGKESEAEMAKWVKGKSPIAVYCFGWSHLLGPELMQIPKLGVIGYHPAALPANRGRHPIVWALALGLESTASTFFRIDEGADSGDIVAQEMVAIAQDDDAGTLYVKLSEIAKRQILNICRDIGAGKLVFRPQDHSKANYWRKRTERDGVIDWRMSSKSIRDLVRALAHPYPGATIAYQGKMIVVRKISNYGEPVASNQEPGKILFSSEKNFVVKTIDGAVEVTDWDRDFRPEPGMYL